MIIKVCGITHQDNLNNIAQLPVDMIGFNFYRGSIRYIMRHYELRTDHINKDHVGVFVDESIDVIKEKIAEYDLDYIQLHGEENTEFCKQVAQLAKVIKVFEITPDFNFDKTLAFEFCDLFLFDTWSPGHGGTGKKFDWKILKKYTGKVPFILAGGIAPGDVEALRKIKHPQFHGVDLNSKFEMTPGFKDVDAIREFIEALNE